MEKQAIKEALKDKYTLKNTVFGETSVHGDFKHVYIVNEYDLDVLKTYYTVEEHEEILYKGKNLKKAIDVYFNKGQ